MSYSDDSSCGPPGAVAFPSQSIFSFSFFAVSLVFESKRDGWYQRLDDEKVRTLLRAAAHEIEQVRELEGQMGVDTLTKSLDPRLASATLAWSRPAVAREGGGTLYVGSVGEVHDIVDSVTRGNKV